MICCNFSTKTNLRLHQYSKCREIQNNFPWTWIISSCIKIRRREWGRKIPIKFPLEFSPLTFNLGKIKLGIQHNEVRSLENIQSSCIGVSLVVLHFLRTQLNLWIRSPHGRTVQWCMVVYDQSSIATEKHPSCKDAKRRLGGVLAYRGRSTVQFHF